MDKGGKKKPKRKRNKLSRFRKKDKFFESMGMDVAPKKRSSIHHLGGKKKIHPMKFRNFSKPIPEQLFIPRGRDEDVKGSEEEIIEKRRKEDMEEFNHLLKASGKLSRPKDMLVEILYDKFDEGGKMNLEDPFTKSFGLDFVLMNQCMPTFEASSLIQIDDLEEQINESESEDENKNSECNQEEDSDEDFFFDSDEVSKKDNPKGMDTPDSNVDTSLNLNNSSGKRELEKEDDFLNTFLNDSKHGKKPAVIKKEISSVEDDFLNDLLDPKMEGRSESEKPNPIESQKKIQDTVEDDDFLNDLLS